MTVNTGELTAVKNADGSVSLNNADGEEVFNIAAPWMTDANNSYSASYQKICNGRTESFTGDLNDIGIWEGIVVFEVGDYLNTINWPTANP